MSESTTKITAEQWYADYLSPFITDEMLCERIDGHGGFEGWVLDGVLAVKDIDGQEATDYDCLELIGLLVSEWQSAVQRGIGDPE